MDWALLLLLLAVASCVDVAVSGVVGGAHAMARRSRRLLPGQPRPWLLSRASRFAAPSEELARMALPVAAVHADALRSHP
jgi:hypothetical protein